MPYTTTIDDTQGTRLGQIFETERSAKAQTEDRNSAAEMLGIKTRYQTTECDESWVQDREKMLP